MEKETEDKTLYTLIIFSENLVGLLSQVTAVFTRRQVNIESLNVSASGVEHIHRYTITCWSDESTIQKITKQIEKKIDVVQANYFKEDEIFILESALFKLSTPDMLTNKEISKVIRLHDANIVEVNSTYCIVTKEGMTEEIISLHDKLQSFNCVLQYVRSGAIAITKSKREQLNEYLMERDFEHKANEKLKSY